jgi:MFS family permease
MVACVLGVTFPERSGRTVGLMGQAQPAPGNAPTAPEVTARRFRAVPPALAWLLGGAVLVLAAAAVVLSAVAGQLSIDITAGVVIVLTFAGVGLVIARRQPGNPIGWMMVAFTLVYVFGAAANYYAVLYYRLGHRGLPLAALALLLSAVQAPSFAMFPVVILLFPDGAVPGRRWRCAVRAYAGLVAFVLAVIVAAAAAALAGHDVRLDARGNLTSSNHLARWLANPPGWLIGPVIAAIVIIGLSFVGHQVLAWRAADGDRRQQLKWLACGGAVAATSPMLAEVLGVAGLLAGLAALPVSIGVGILRYQLYDIDQIISRTLAYALVTGVLAGVYAGLVLLATKVLSVHAPVAVAAATLAAAALFNTLRQRVQQIVDRRFNRARYDAEQTVAAFAARLKDAVDLDSIRDDLAGTVHQALEPSHISVWVSRRS